MAVRTRSAASAVDRIVAWADRQEQQAQDALARPRLTNTRRRVAQAASAEMNALRARRTARSVRAIAHAIARGELPQLAGVTNAAQVVTLLKLLDLAWSDAVRQEAGRYVPENERRPLRVSDADHAHYPWPCIHLSAVDRKRWRAAVASLWEEDIALSRRADRLTREVEDRLVIECQEAWDCKALDALRPHMADAYLAKRIADSLASWKRLDQMGLRSADALRAALRAIAPYVEGVKKPDPIAAAERGLVGLRIRGFFATPRPVVQRLLAYAAIPADAPVAVLEPSAGKGDIADWLAAAYPQAQVHCCEVSPTLAGLLRLKGHTLLAADCFDLDPAHYRADYVVMNPLFEDGKDIDHVRHAYTLLRGGGRLVAIMGMGVTFRGDRKTREFAAWLEDVGGTVVETLPAGTFQESGTGVAACIVVIDKDQEDV